MFCASAPPAVATTAKLTANQIISERIEYLLYYPRRPGFGMHDIWGRCCRFPVGHPPLVRQFRRQWFLWQAILDRGLKLPQFDLDVGEGGGDPLDLLDGELAV